MSGDRVLAIDCGTQSVRALLFDLHGNLVAGTRVPFEPPYTEPRPGWAEHDAEDYWSCLAAACRSLWASGVDPGSVAGVALTTQRDTIVLVDGDGRPLRPAIVWLDQRRATGLRPLGGPLGLAFRALGVAGFVADFQAKEKANWLALQEPDVWARTAKYLMLSGFLTHRLVGRFVDSAACQPGHVPFDYKRQAWARPSDWRWKLGPILPDQLPELSMPAVRLGDMAPSASDATGIPAGLPVIAAAGDKACEVLGSGVVDPSLGCLSYGTTATVNVTSERYVEPYRFVPPYPSAVPGDYSVEVEVYRGFWMVSWFRREFGLAEEQRASALGVEPETLFDDLLAEAPPGSRGLVLQPYWSPGIRVPGPEAKGAIVGFGGAHGRAHLYRAMLEGLAYSLRDGLEHIERRTGTPVRELRVSGGGSRSDGAVQLTADVFGLPAGRPHTSDTSALGAAIAAAVGLGLHPSFEAAVAAMTRVADVREPNPNAHELYEALYRRVYRKMYERLQPRYREIRDITGYPPG